MVKVQSPTGWRPVKIAPPGVGDSYNHDPKKWYGNHELIVVPDQGQLGGEEHDVPVEQVPEGYCVVAWRAPEIGELAVLWNGATQQVIQCSIDVSLPYPIVKPAVKVDGIKGYRPVRIGFPERSDLIWDCSIKEAYGGPFPYPELIVEEGESEDEVWVPVYDLPEGYRPVRWGRPEKGELYLSSGGRVLAYRGVTNCAIEPWLIVEKING